LSFFSLSSFGFSLSRFGAAATAKSTDGFAFILSISHFLLTNYFLFQLKRRKGNALSPARSDIKIEAVYEVEQTFY